MILVGVDPGINGAAAAFFRADHEGPEFVADVIDMPTLDDGKRREINVRQLAEWIRKMQPARAFVENVQPMMGKGRDSQAMMGAASFRFGLVVGQIRATLTCCDVPISLIHPQVWKRYYDLRGSDKEQSRQMALQLHPEAVHWLKRKKDDGRAEAILLARYGDRHLIAHRNS